MDAWFNAFKEIAPYLTHPLVLVGFVLLLFFGLHRTLLKAGIIPPLTARTGGKVVQLLLRYGFVIALVVIVLGFALQFYRTHRETQPPIDVGAIIEQLEARHRQEMARMQSHYQEDVGDWKRQAAEAVVALTNLRAQPNAPPEIQEALAMLEEGRTEKAEAIFQKIAEQKAEDIQEAAAAYRHLGALALFRDTQRALAAYRRSTELDPDNAENWNQLGNLSRRAGELDESEAAYLKVQAIGEATNNHELIAVASDRLDVVYEMRRERVQTEEMDRSTDNFLPPPDRSALTTLPIVTDNNILLDATKSHDHKNARLTIKAIAQEVFDHFYAIDVKIRCKIRGREPVRRVGCKGGFLGTDDDGEPLVIIINRARVHADSIRGHSVRSREVSRIVKKEYYDANVSREFMFAVVSEKGYPVGDSDIEELFYEHAETISELTRDEEVIFENLWVVAL